MIEKMIDCYFIHLALQAYYIHSRLSIREIEHPVRRDQGYREHGSTSPHEEKAL
jgi:hypothetical protein